MLWACHLSTQLSLRAMLCGLVALFACSTIGERTGAALLTACDSDLIPGWDMTNCCFVMQGDDCVMDHRTGPPSPVC